MTAEEVVEFAEALARASAGGGGIKALATLLAQRSGAAVLVEDAKWRPLATAGEGSLPATARDAGDRLTTVPIAVGATPPYGWLSLAANGTDRGAHVTLARLASSTMAVELAREASAGASRKRGFWERAIDGGYHDAAEAREDAAARGIALVPQYVCLALEHDAGRDLRPLATDTLRVAGGELGFIERGSVLIVLVPAAREVDVENARTAASLLPKTAVKRKLNGALAGGVSRAAALPDLTRAAAEAIAALAIVRRLYGFGHVAAHEALGAYPLLYSGASVDALRAFSAAVLAPLRAYDDKHQTELERTLAVYFASGQNVKTTATELAVHRHTVFYRLRQIAEISERSLESAHDQLTLRLAIATDALHT